MIFIQVLTVSTVDEMAQADISQGPLLILESYSKLMMMMKVCMKSKIPGLVQVKREVINCVPYAIFYHDSSAKRFMPHTKNEPTPVNCSWLQAGTMLQ